VDPLPLQPQMVQEMLNSRKYPGNMLSKVFMNDHSFMFLEKWNGTSGLKHHEEHPERFTNVSNGVIKALSGNSEQEPGFSLPFSVSSSSWSQIDAQAHSPQFEIPSDNWHVTESTQWCVATTQSGFTHLRIESDYVDPVKNKMASMVKTSRNENGNSFYIAMTGSAHKDEFLVVEQWRDHDALDQHLHSTNVLRLFGLSQLMIQDQGMRIKGGYKELIPCK